MQGKESPVGSNTQETHQYVGPYRLEKTLGKGQTGKCNRSFTLSYASCVSINDYTALTINRSEDSPRHTRSERRCSVIRSEWTKDNKGRIKKVPARCDILVVFSYRFVSLDEFKYSVNIFNRIVIYW